MAIGKNDVTIGVCVTIPQQWSGDQSMGVFHRLFCFQHPKFMWNKITWAAVNYDVCGHSWADSPIIFIRVRPVYIVAIGHWYNQHPSNQWGKNFILTINGPILHHNIITTNLYIYIHIYIQGSKSHVTFLDNHWFFCRLQVGIHQAI